MTKTSTARKVAARTGAKVAALPTPAAKVAATFKGKALVAFNGIAPSSYRDGMSRAETIRLIDVALGKNPSADEVKAVKTQRIIGRVATKLPATIVGEEKRLAYASDLVLLKAKPATDGCKPIRAHQIGRRTEKEQKLVRAAEQEASQLLAEIGRSGAQTQAAHTAKKRAPSMAGAGKGKAKPNATELVEKAKPVDAAGYVEHMQTQLAALLAFDNKHAKVRPITHGAFAEALSALRTLGNKAANEFQVSKAK